MNNRDAIMIKLKELLDDVGAETCHRMPLSFNIFDEQWFVNFSSYYCDDKDCWGCRLTLDTNRSDLNSLLFDEYDYCHTYVYVDDSEEFKFEKVDTFLKYIDTLKNLVEISNKLRSYILKGGAK